MTCNVKYPPDKNILIDRLLQNTHDEIIADLKAVTAELYFIRTGRIKD